MYKLKNGDIVQFRDSSKDSRYLVVYMLNNIILWSLHGFMTIEYYDESLKDKCGDSDFDIIKVWSPTREKLGQGLGNILKIDFNLESIDYKLVFEQD